MFDGQPYDFVQSGIVGNHVALVKYGRCGSDVRIFDKAIVCDSMEIPKMEINKEKLKSILDGMDEATLSKANDLLVKLADGCNEDEAAKKAKEEEAAKKKAAEDEAAKKAAEEEAKKKAEDEAAKKAAEDEAAKQKADEDAAKKKAEDEAAQAVKDEAIRKEAAKQVMEAIKLHDRLVPHIGEFCMDEMLTVQDVAAYGCKKLELEVNAGSEIATLTGFLAGCKDATKKVVTTDSAADKGGFDFAAAYLAK